MQQEFSSFRDPSGMIYRQDGRVRRLINQCYRPQYERLMQSGLYQRLVKAGLLVPHVELPELPPNCDARTAYKAIEPAQVPMISYPYEWSFGQLKDAALVTLRAHRMALERDMVLKDASAYNIQQMNGRMLLIDTLSFDLYTEGQLWIAYGQFCRHFLAPLCLMAYRDVRLLQLLRVYIDGVPLDLASELLQGKGGLGVRQHIHWHARATQKHARDGGERKPIQAMSISRFNHIAMIESLTRMVEALRLKDIQTEWGDYYDRTNYSDAASQCKARLVAEYARAAAPRVVWDFGANNGYYTRIAAGKDAFGVAFDIDPVAVERNYRALRQSKEKRLLPLLLDVTNPSPGIGFAGRERTPIQARQQPDCLLALALVHHLAISNNLPLGKIADWFASLAPWLIIEFVPKEDSQARTLLSTREDIFPDYTWEGFEAAFAAPYELIRSEKVEDSLRTLYLYRRRG